MIFLILGKVFWVLKTIFNKTLLIWGYRVYKLTEKKLAGFTEERGKETGLDSGERRSFLSFANRKYLFHIVMLILAILVATDSLQAKGKIDVAGGATDSIILNLLGATGEEEVIMEEGVPDTLNTPATYLPSEAAVSVLPQMKPETREEQEAETEERLATSEGSAALMKPAISTTVATPRKRTEIIEYTVREGDTISGVAQEFGISSNTVLWENGLSKYSLIRPGQILRILPVTGLTHAVSRGENLSTIAKKYDADVEAIINENKLADATDIKSEQKLIIPNGIKPAPVRQSYDYSSSRTLLSRIISEPPTGEIVDQRAGRGHQFPWGQCTWYVAQKRYIPWNGHAKYWITNARKMGYKIGTVPVIGAIIATKENWLFGHVGYVEAAGNNTVTFSEMNYMGVGIYSRRTLSQDDSRIIGYIY